MKRWNTVGYGLDVQGHEAVFVRATRKGARLSYETCQSDDGELKRDIESGQPVAVSMTPRQCLTPRLKAPYASRRKAEKVFPTLLDIQLPFALEGCVYEILAETDEDRETCSALAVVARTRDVQGVIERVQAMGIDPTHVDHEGVAMWVQSLREVPLAAGDTTLPRVIVYLGEDRTTLTVGIGNQYLASHGMSRFDATHLRRLLRSSLGAEGTRVQWLWTGPEAGSVGTSNALAEALVTNWPGETSTHDDPSTFLARALASRCLVPDSKRCNLRLGALAHPRSERRLASAVRTAALLMLGAGIVFCAAGLVGKQWIERRVDEADARFSRDAESVLGYSPGAARGEYALRMVRQHVAQRQDDLRPLLEPFSTSLTHVIAAMVSKGVDPGVRFDVVILNGKQFEFGGALREWSVGEELTAVLESHGYRGDLSRGEAMGDGWIPFSIKGRGRG